MISMDDQSEEVKGRTRDRLEAMENLRAMQEDAMARGLNYSEEEIDQIIQEARRERKARTRRR
jgi:hypothetical protein